MSNRDSKKVSTAVFCWNFLTTRRHEATTSYWCCWLERSTYDNMIIASNNIDNFFFSESTDSAWQELTLVIIVRFQTFRQNANKRNVNTLHVKHSTATFCCLTGCWRSTWNWTLYRLKLSNLVSHAQTLWQVTLIEIPVCFCLPLGMMPSQSTHVLVSSRGLIILSAGVLSSSFHRNLPSIWFMIYRFENMCISYSVDFVWCLFAFPRNNYISTLYTRLFTFLVKTLVLVACDTLVGRESLDAI
jgi:hypothetical protein